MDAIAKTSLYTAMLRARESARPDRLFADPFAEALAGVQGRDLLERMEARSPGAARNPVVPIRTKFYDDSLQHLVGGLGGNQLVILAAGLDTRAYRLAWPPDLALFELDRPEVLELKATRLAELDASPRCRRIPIPTDLTANWPLALVDGGFDQCRPSVWLVEGLTPYLTEMQVQQLLGALSALAADGSWLLTDIFGRSFLTSPQMAGFRTMMAANGSPLLFGTDSPEGLLADHGWRPKVTQIGGADANYGRWILPEGYREDADSPHGYLVVAQR